MTYQEQRPVLVQAVMGTPIPMVPLRREVDTA
jgi:hypothetical protein